MNPHHKALRSLKKSFSGRINFLSNAFRLDSCIYFTKPGLTITFLYKKKKSFISFEHILQIGKGSSRTAGGFQVMPASQSQTNYFLIIFCVRGEKAVQ